MSETVIVALLSLLGTLGGTLGGILATTISSIKGNVLIDIENGSY